MPTHILYSPCAYYFLYITKMTGKAGVKNIKRNIKKRQNMTLRAVFLRSDEYGVLFSFLCFS